MQSENEYIKGYWAGLDAALVKINSIDTENLNSKETRKAVYLALLELKPK